VVRLPNRVRPTDNDLQSLRALGAAWRVGKAV
jgi:transposase